MSTDDFVDAQARCDAVATIHGGRAPEALDGESLRQYRRRLLAPFQPQSAWRGVDLSSLASDAFAVAESAIYADASGGIDAAIGPGQLRPRVKHDASGRPITEWLGDPAAWMTAYRGPKQRVVNFLTHQAGTAVIR